jgi:hypothetical protein
VAAVEPAAVVVGTPHPREALRQVGVRLEAQVAWGLAHVGGRQVPAHPVRDAFRVVVREDELWAVDEVGVAAGRVGLRLGRHAEADVAVGERLARTRRRAGLLLLLTAAVDRDPHRHDDERGDHQQALVGGQLTE